VSTQRHGCGDCELGQAGVGYENAYPGWNRPKESGSAPGFGNRTIPDCWTPGFASPPHDGFAFVDRRPWWGDGDTLTRQPK